jgi:hypothetical protein
MTHAYLEQQIETFVELVEEGRDAEAVMVAWDLHVDGAPDLAAHLLETHLPYEAKRLGVVDTTDLEESFN